MIKSGRGGKGEERATYMGKELDMRFVRVTVSGSFTKHWDDIQAAVQQFSALGVGLVTY